MRLTLPFAAAALAAAAPAAADTRAWNPAAFDRLSVAGAYTVEVVTGGTPSVRATGDADDLEKVRVRVEDGTLRIDTRPGSWRMGSVRVRVVARPLRAVAVAGASDVRLDRARARSFTGSVAGSGELAIDAVDVGALALSVAGSGSLDARGRCDRLTASIAGSGTARLGALRCNALTADVMGSGDLAAHADRTATITAAGSGDVRISGRPSCTVSRAGSATISCGA